LCIFTSFLSQKSSQTGPNVPVTGFLAKTLPEVELWPPTSKTGMQDQAYAELSLTKIH
jgi:hypothetical protein